jgi:hypothetical protein
LALGAFPVVPGAPMSWIASAPYFTTVIPANYWILSIIGNHYHFNIRIYYPVQRNKTIRRKFLWHLGTNIGLVAGLLSPIPFGFLIGAFTGALIESCYYMILKSQTRLKAAAGSFIDF